MKSRVVLVGCGSANLFAALYLIDKGYDPKLITVIESGSEPRTRTSMLKGFAGAGLKSDGKFVFSFFPDPLSKHITDGEKQEYYSYLQSTMRRFLDIPESGISVPYPEDKLQEVMSGMDNDWQDSGMTLRQSTVWHIGTDNELIMAINMYDMMVSVGINFMFKTTVTDINFNSNTIMYKTSSRVEGTIGYDYLQVGAGKVGVDFVDELVKEYNIPVDYGYANVGGRFETVCSDIIKKFANDVQYDFKFLKTYDDGQMEVRSFCTCNYSAYVIEEGISGTRTYNGHAYGKDHEKENGMTNFGVIARIKGINAHEFHKAVLSKFGKGGCVIRGRNWNGKSTISKVENEIYWDDLYQLYRTIGTDDIGGRLVRNLKDFIVRMNKIFQINDNYSYYVPEIKMAVGVIDTNRNYNMAGGRYSNVSFVGDCSTGSVGIIPAAVTGIRGVEVLIK